MTTPDRSQMKKREVPVTVAGQAADRVFTFEPQDEGVSV
jgi:hypothetical protein